MEIRRVDARKAALAVWFAFVVYVLMNAWVSEDAYITLRVVDNFFRGYGLRWNVTERVQVYTHPLWLLLHIPLHVFIPNLFVVSCLLSVACTAAAMYVTLNLVTKSLPVTLVCLFLPCLASKAFFDFTTSGLENALFYLLYAVFGTVVLKYSGHPRFWLALSLTSALMLFNRLDTVIFIAPALCWLGYERWKEIEWRQVWLGAVPLVLWLGFALVYYGFIFPNTKHAKLDTGLEPLLYLREGWHYFRYLAVMDIPSALMLFAAPLLVWAMARGAHRHALAPFPVMLSLGAVLYCLYIVNIGGDYMMGRFWAFPVFASIWIFYVFMPSVMSGRVLACVAVALTMTSGPVMKPLRDKCKACTVAKGRMDDARHVFGGNTLMPKWWPVTFNTEARHKFVGWGKNIAALVPPHTEKAHYIGMVGYFAGPGNVLIDEVALADPLLARLPVSPLRPFYIGHFYRTIPAGYIEAVRTGDLGKMDPSLAKYYEKLSIITSGPVFSLERLKTIARFNLGAYDHWKYDYLNCNVWS